ncbi:MAG TPA: DHHA1 domain-containing protein, partial [Candidatus Polarisedimenticolaceae bacterium]|nr:DHHA1 domain-containing protein [Candidatus Polarisedimenticolaceae bacterium]
DIELGEMRSHHLGFGLGPRLNAAGRLEHANYSLELVTTKDPIEAQALAFQLEELNHQRQLEQERITTEASALAEMYTADPVLVLADPGWSHGVVGIVASKLAERYGKPTLVLQIMSGHAKGSGRSANGYSLIEGLRFHQDLFTKVGGHDFAAGFTLPTEYIGQLRISMNNHYRQVAADLPAQAGRKVDLKIEDSRDIGWDFYNNVRLLEPFGNGNMQPCFAIDGMKVVSVDTVGKQKRHLKVRLADPHGGVFEAIGFGLAEHYPGLRKGQTVNIQCYIQKNQWGDKVTLQFGLLGIQ